MLLKAAVHEQLAGAGPVDHRLPFLLLMEEHPLDGSEISPRRIGIHLSQIT